MNRIPPLKAVRAFDATARHLSFSKAAEELCVTQSAVSHQVKILEEFLGKALFFRRGKQISLTQDGTIFFSVVGDCFQRMSSVTNHLMNEEAVTLKVLVQASIGAQWLAPRIGHFQKENPTIRVALDTEVYEGNFSAKEYDVLVGAWTQPEGFVSRPLNVERWFPVCTPELFAEIDINNPASLLKLPLYSSENGEDWNLWIQAQRLEKPASLDIRYFNLALLTFRASLGGLGIALTSDFIAGEAIKRGSLVPMYELSYSLPWGHYSVHSRSDSHRGKQIDAFNDWLDNQLD